VVRFIPRLTVSKVAGRICVLSAKAVCRDTASMVGRLGRDVGTCREEICRREGSIRVSRTYYWNSGVSWVGFLEESSWIYLGFEVDEYMFLVRKRGRMDNTYVE
jgi:hypothetical protein